MLGKLLSRSYQNRQLDEFFKPVQIAEMLLCGCQRIERSDARGFLAFLDREIFTQAARNGELPIHHRQHSAQEEQISSVRRLDVSPQRCRGRGQHDSELANTRTWSVYDRIITTWRRHV